MFHKMKNDSPILQLSFRYWIFNFLFVVVASWLTAIFILLWILFIGPEPLTREPDLVTSMWSISTAHPHWVIALGLLFLIAVLGLWSLAFTIFMKRQFWQPEEYIDQLTETLIDKKTSDDQRQRGQQRLTELISHIHQAQQRLSPHSSTEPPPRVTPIEAEH